MPRFLVPMLLAAIAALAGCSVCADDPGTPAPAPARGAPAPGPATSEPDERAVERVELRDDAARAAGAPRTYPAERVLVGITGTVLDAFGQPVASAAVMLQPGLGGVHPLLAIADDRSRLPATSTDVTGTFAFPRVAVGPYDLRARAADGRSASLAIAVTGDGEPFVLRLPPDTGADWRVIAVDSAGNRLPGVRVELHVVPATDGIVDENHPAERTAVT